jgi:seryl-tRNA synthetase
MIDIKFIRENPELIKEACCKKQVEVDIDRLLELDNQRRDLLQKVEGLRSERNKITEKIAKEKTEDLIKQAKEIKERTSRLEEELKKIEQEYNQLLYLVPNPPLGDVPEGKDESENVVVREVGKRTEFDFEPKPYWELGENLDLIDVKRAAKTSGTRFGFLKNEGALLEFALINFALKILSEYDFAPVVPPVLIRPEMMKGMGYVERGEEQIYRLAGDDLYLIGTSEQIIGPMHADEIFEENELPKRYVGFSGCFRREAGTYGKDTKGIFRVHQFDKVEMFIFCKPEDSVEEHQLLLSLEEKIMQELGLPYRVVQMCTGDLGDPAASKYDIEAWFPSQQQYRETHSTSNCTDFQARRLNIRYKDKKSGKLEVVHTLNGTAIAIGRTILAILENYQEKDGCIRIPRALRPYLDFKIISRK